MADQNGQPTEDLYALSDEDFMKQYAEAQAAAKKADPEPEGGAPADQPRDEHGRFAKKEEGEPDETVYRYEIDLGDGSGKQVFEGESYEDLIEKLGKAQEHATRKIRELSAVKKTEDPKKDETAISEDEDWLLSQELMSTPSKAFPKLIERTFGKDPKAIKEALDEVETVRREKREQAVAKQFMETHPDLPYNPHNGALVERYFQTYKMDVTAENLEKVFAELAESGLLKPNAAPTKDSEVTPTDPKDQRIAAPAGTTVVVRKKAASGLSAKSAAAAPELTVDDLYNLPMADFEKLGGMSKQDNW